MGDSTQLLLENEGGRILVVDKTRDISGLVKAVKASIFLVCLAGISYGLLLASVFIRMDPVNGVFDGLKRLFSV